jgi:hypothetical protein
MLRGMGFNKSTYIFLAAGPIYSANRTMAPLLEMFPNLQTKEMLASEEDLAPFKVSTIFHCLFIQDESFLTCKLMCLCLELLLENGCNRLHGVSPQ